MQATLEVILPSGLRGVIRKMKVADIDLMANPTSGRQSGPVSEFELCNRLWVQTLDRGPYNFSTDKPPWSDCILQGDRFKLVLEARVLTRGSDYEFDCQCDSPACRAMFRWGLDLSDLPTIPISQRALDGLAAGNLFHTFLPAIGHRVIWMLPTGSIQTAMDKMVKQHGRGIGPIYAARILKVEAKAVEDTWVEVEVKDLAAYVGDLDLDDFDLLIGDMQDVDCGVDTGIEIECPHCGRRQFMDVGFGGDFFMRDLTRSRSSRPKGR